jgi:shikimate kinase
LPDRAEPASRRAVFLIGFMGSGKSSVGRALGRRLGWRFIDLDARIEAAQGRRIEAIFRNSGEEAFRQAETEELRRLLRELDAQSEVIVALGGGAWVQPDNFRLLKSCGIPAVFLDAPVEVLWQRCQGEAGLRPLARDGNEFQRTYQLRRARYLDADIRIDTADKDVETVAAEVISWLGLD